MAAPPLEPAALGFGCASLPVEQPRLARRLLDCAYEQGIRHYDVARMYGGGETEAVLGGFLRGKRDQLTVTTKFGLEPTPRSLKGDLKERARRAMRALPLLHGAAKRLKRGVTAPAAPPALPRHFDLATARRSLDTSLRLLGTDHIDFWLLHEASAADAADPSLLEFLEQARAAGKVRTYGVGTAAAALLPHLPAYPAAYELFQFDSHLLNGAAARFRAASPARFISHGALAPLAQLRGALKAQPAAVRGFRADTGLDVAAPDTLAALLLQSARWQNPGGMVLFASSRIEHLRRNARLLAGTGPDAEACERFAALFADAAGH